MTGKQIALITILWHITISSFFSYINQCNMEYVKNEEATVLTRRIKYRLGGPACVRLTNKNMSMSETVYILTSIVTTGLEANHHTGNGLDHLYIVECSNVLIIFPFTYSSRYSLWQGVNWTYVHECRFFHQCSAFFLNFCYLLVFDWQQATSMFLSFKIALFIALSTRP